jgi:hypothetical protein
MIGQAPTLRNDDVTRERDLDKDYEELCDVTHDKLEKIISRTFLLKSELYFTWF